MSYSSPDGADMDSMNRLSNRIKQDEILYKESFRMMDPKDNIGNLLIPTKRHIKVLIDQIRTLQEQINFAEVYGDLKKQDPY